MRGRPREGEAAGRPVGQADSLHKALPTRADARPARGKNQRRTDPDATSPAADNQAGAPDDPAYVYFRIVPLDQSAVVSALEAGPPDPQVQFFSRTVPVAQAPRNFQTGVRTFNAPLSAFDIAYEQLGFTKGAGGVRISMGTDSIFVRGAQGFSPDDFVFG